MNSYDSKPVYFTRSSNQILDIKQFIDNPFIPKPIADELHKFFVPTFEVIEDDSLRKSKESIVTITTKIFVESGGRTKEDIPSSYYIQGNSKVMLSWLNFKTFSNKLTKEIEKWFKSHGINDINLRTDYKNVNF